MNVTITCDSTNTQRIIQQLLSVGLLHTTDSMDLKFHNIDYNEDDKEINIMFNVVPESDKSSRKKKGGKIYLYAARDTTTGKLVSDLTNPRRKYWDRKVNAESAINSYNKYHQCYNTGVHDHVDLVKFELVEVPIDG